jgi:CheY-like chemotaxis protein
MKTVLLVHDHQENPHERKQQIEASGYAVELLQRSDECLARLEHARPDLLMIDVLLEGQNGFELCRRVREKYPAAELPIVLSSRVYVDERYYHEAEGSGAQAYMIRPLPVRELVRTVHRWARQGAASWPTNGAAAEPSSSRVEQSAT